MKITRTRVFKLVLVLGLLVGGFPLVYYVFFLQLIRVPVAAMANTIIPGDHLVVQKRAFGGINRGDVIVFKYPKDTSTVYLFRVVGLPRETIEMRGRAVYIDGTELSEQRVMVASEHLIDADTLKELSTEGSGPYRVFYAAAQGGDPSAMPPESEYPFGSNGGFRIPENEYFVMGDNRDNSEDSRYWGTVPRALVLGKPTMIYWSVSRDNEGNESVRWDRVFSKIRND